MKFRLEIDCDNAAFAPPNDDASEHERYDAALAQVLWIMERMPHTLSPDLRGNFVRDANGNRCGRWDIGEESDESSGRPRVVVTGNPIDGVTLNGPFATYDDACEWGEEHGESEWWVTSLADPAAS